MQLSVLKYIWPDLSSRFFKQKMKLSVNKKMTFIINPNI
jgi:hypothetical protein